MQLLLDIHRLRTDRFAYSFRTDSLQPDDCTRYECAFDSLETCLRDAGDSIGHYFPDVYMRYQGQMVGACRTESLRRHPQQLAARFMAVTQGVAAVA